MSAQNYKIIIGFDDSQMAKLSKQFGGTFGTSKAGGASGGLGGNTALFKNLTKLGIIATAAIGTLKGIEKLVSLTVNSSPMLGAMLKIMSTAVTFILRPIGDFIGFFLRPMMVLFLRYAVQIYKEWGPTMRNLGAVLGANFFAPIESALSYFTKGVSERQQILDSEYTSAVTRNMDAMLGFKEALHSVGADLRSGSIALDFTTLMDNLSTQISSALTGVGAGILGTIDFSGINSSTKLWSDNFKKNISDTSNALTTGFSSFISFFDSLGTNLSVLYTGVILPGVTAIGEFFNTMTTSITDIITTAWNAITQFFQEIVEFFTTIPQQIMSSIIPQSIEQTAASAQEAISGISVSFYDTIIQGAESITDFGEGISSIIQDAVAGRSS